MKSLKTKAALKWTIAVSAIAVFTMMLPQAQGTVSGGLAVGTHHRWMGELFSLDPALMDQSLARFIFPGTHDSGTYGLVYAAACEGCEGADRFYDIDATCRDYMPPALEGVCDSAGGFMEIVGQAWGQAQHLTVGGLLDAGARHFDLRFFRATAADAARTGGGLVQGSFYIHHSLAGADSISILNDIQRFLDDPSNAQEIVILEFSKMKEGTGDMDADTIGLFFDQVRQRFGNKMAKRQVSACASDPTGCSATQRFGHATTLREFLAQGSQVIVTCASCAIAGDDIWDSITWTTPSGVSGLNADAGEGYPAPDNAYFPWRTDQEYVSIIQQLSAKRDSYPQDEMFAVGMQIGLDNDGLSMIRGLSCHLDPENVSGECGAVNNDWDAFRGLEDVANFTNPMALAALVGLRRDRVNIVTFDHYDIEMTDEIFKLNLGATRVFHRIDRVENTDAMDLDSGPDYYPWFHYPLVAPLSLQMRLQRYNQIPNRYDISPHWPAWKAYPNTWGTAEVMFAIVDADPGIGLDDDDQSLINIPLPVPLFGPGPYVVDDQVPIGACVRDATNCLRLNAQQSVSGANGPDSSNVWFSRSSCVWSWAPRDLANGVDTASLCGEALPELRVYDGVRLEGNSDSAALEFVVSLSAPSLKPLTVEFSTSDGTAQAGSDYTPAANVALTFAPGQTRVTAKVFVTGDTDVEGDESFTVTLGNASSATIADGAASGTILNDDAFDGPAVSAPGSQTGSEGGLVPFSLGTLADSRPAVVSWTVDVDWGDGSAESYGVSVPGPLRRSHTYADNGSYSVGVSVTAADGVAAPPITFTATIGNVNPRATLRNNGPVSEGDAVVVSFSGPHDPSSADTTAGFHYAFSCTNSSLDAATYATSSSAPTTSCTFADDGVHIVRGRIIDKDGGAAEYTTTVTVVDVAPVLTAPAGQAGSEGSTLAFGLGTLTDTSADGPWTITVNWGDANAESFPANAPGALTRSHVYADNGAYTVTVSARDASNVASNPVTFAATIANVAPAITAVGSAVDENGTATVSGTITDPGVRDTFVITVSWGDGTSSPHAVAAGATSYSLTHQYLDDDPTATPSDASIVTVSVADKDGATGSGATGVAVRNLSPQVGAPLFHDETGTTSGDLFLALTGLPVDLDVAFTDAGTRDTHQGSIDWGDGISGAGTVTESGGTGTLSARHAWSSPGTFTVGVTVTDDDTGVGMRQATIAVTDAKGAVCAIGQFLASMLTDPTLNRETVSALTQLLGKTYGNVDGLAANGACDMFAKADYVAAVVKLEQAVNIIDALVAGGSLTPARLAVLRQVEARLVLVAKWTALTLSRTTTDPQTLADAAALGQLADVAALSGDYAAAIGRWLEAVRLLDDATEPAVTTW